MWIIISKFEICQNCAHENLYTNNLFTRFCTAFVQNTDKTIKTHLSLHNHAPHTNLTFWSEQTHTSKLTFPSTTTHLTEFTGKLHLTGHFTSQHAPHILVKIESYQQNESCAESEKRQVRSKKRLCTFCDFIIVQYRRLTNLIATPRISQQLADDNQQQ